MWKIIDNLYLGTKEDSEDFDLLTSKQISHIVNCAEELPCLFEEDFEYLSLLLKDPDDRLRSRLGEALPFIGRGRQEGAVMVHCRGGVSRSPAVIMAYLCYSGFEMKQAAQLIRNEVQSRPNLVFLRQIFEYLGVDATDGDLDLLLRTLGGLD